MQDQKWSNDAVHWYMSDLSSRIVAKSGRPEDRYHIGKLLWEGFKDAPDHVLQIDASTDEQETNASVLDRTIKCAISMRNMGLGVGDVIVLMAPNHLDLAIPYYAAMYMGVIVAAVDRTLTVNELTGTFENDRPKAIFCQSEKASDIQLALNSLELDTEIITFDEGDYLCSFTEFLEKYGDSSLIEEFLPTDFDPEETIALLIATSGTTGLPKATATSHKNMAVAGPYWWSRFRNFPTPTPRVMVGSPLQWLTALAHFMFSPIFRYTRIQSTLPILRDHAHHMINTYKPTFTVISPTLMMTLIRPPERDNCDFTCFEYVMLGGSALPAELVFEMKKIAPNTEVRDGYGMSELSGIAFHQDDPPMGSCGKPMGCFQYRLVDVTTMENITEPNQQGELWMKGPSIFKGYYNNPTATEETFAEDGWFRTGDIFYRDKNCNFYFVERYKLLLKYMSYHISPVEVEAVIRQHPGVLDVAVTGIPDPECGDLAVACVVRAPESDVDAQTIKDLVKGSLADSKQLRGGVVFLNEIPMTASTKIHRRKIKEIALEMERE